MTVITIRGANGSGKSYTIRQLIKKLGGFCSLSPHYKLRRKHPLYYTCDSPPFALIGHYESQCGGADTVPFSEVGPLVINLTHDYHVIYESMLFSVEAKQLLIIRDLVPDVRVIQLSTSADECIENIYTRRRKSGNRLGTPLDEGRVRLNHKRIEQVRQKLLAVGVVYMRLSSRQAVRVIYGWLHESIL